MNRVAKVADPNRATRPEVRGTAAQKETEMQKGRPETKEVEALELSVLLVKERRQRMVSEMVLMTISASYLSMRMISVRRFEPRAIEWTKMTKSNIQVVDREAIDREAIDQNVRCLRKMIVAVETKTVKPSRPLRRAERSHPGQKLSKELSLPTPRIINETLEAEDEAAGVVLGSNAEFQFCAEICGELHEIG